MPHPAAQRLAKALLMTARNVQKGRRTRPAVEIFVAAADGKIDFVAIEEQVHGSRAVAQIPKHKRAAIMRRFGERSHVMQFTRLVMNMRQDHECHIAR